MKMHTTEPLVKSFIESAKSLQESKRQLFNEIKNGLIDILNKEDIREISLSYPYTPQPVHRIVVRRLEADRVVITWTIYIKLYNDGCRIGLHKRVVQLESKSNEEEDVYLDTIWYRRYTTFKDVEKDFYTIVEDMVKIAYVD